MSSVAAALEERWFVHKAILEEYESVTRNSDNQPVINYSDSEEIPSCRIQDLSAEEIQSLTESGVLNASHKLLVPVSRNPALESKIHTITQNGKGYGSTIGSVVDSRVYVIVHSYVRRSYSDDYRQLFLRRIG